MVEYYDPKPAKKKPLNGAQFSQMGLFEQPKPSAEHQWPMGYSPERKAEVSAMLEPASRISMTAKHGGITKGMFKDPHEFGRSNLKGQRQQARAQIVDTIARSSMPVEEMANMPSFKVGGTSKYAAGSYRPPQMYRERTISGGSRVNKMPGAKGMIYMDPYQEKSRAEHTLIHELGHHADFERDPNEFYEKATGEKVPIMGTRASPSLEGAAEGYAFGHLKARRGQELQHYDERGSYGPFRRDPRFQINFESASGGTTIEEATAKPPSHLGAQWDPKAPHQQHLFGRPADMAETEIQKDYGQWGYASHVTGRETPLGTIRLGRGAPPIGERLHPGFKAEDPSRIQDIRAGRGYGIPKRERNRIIKHWNARRPGEPLKDVYP